MVKAIVQMKALFSSVLLLASIALVLMKAFPTVRHFQQYYKHYNSTDESISNS